MKIAITGGIGSGKSYVCRLLEQRGISIYDCDSAAKRLMHTSEPLRQQLTELIGPDTYDNEGRLNKAVVAQFLLQSEENAKAIDNIVHPAVAHDFQNSGYQWMECAILFESGFEQLVDRIIVVTAPEEVRINRIMHRDGINSEKAQEWSNRQWSQEKVRQRADFEIVNDGKQDLNQKINDIILSLSKNNNVITK
jgi:dephospho-CoA kinase